ncbi:hypothetical protein BDQ17DRAFT_1223721, partial [Cyathus striatus]
FGDWYRGCSHFKPSYYSGGKVDCGSTTCKNSISHTHKALNCGCSAISEDERRIQSMFHQACEECRS